MKIQTLKRLVAEDFEQKDQAMIQKLAFVFRNSDGSKQGKTSTGGDIFYDVHVAGLAVSITSPLNQPYFTDAGASFNIQVEAMQSTQVKVLIDNVEKSVSLDILIALQFNS